MYARWFGQHPSGSDICDNFSALRPQRLGVAPLTTQHQLDRLLDFLDEEGFALDFIEAAGVGEEAAADEQAELAVVEFGDQNLLELAQHLGQVPGERAEVTQLGAAHGFAFGPGVVHGGGDAAVGAAPAEHEQLAAGGVAVDGEFGEGVGDLGDFGGAEADHVLVVLRVVGDVAAAVLFFEAAEAVFAAGGAGEHPGAGEVFVAGVGLEVFGGGV